MAAFSRAEWNSIISATRAKILECNPEADVSDLVEVEPNHVWAKSDLRLVMGRLRTIRADCNEFFDFTDYDPLSNQITEDLWLKRMIDEINIALGQECCDQDCWLVNFSVEIGFELIAGAFTFIVDDDDIPANGSGCVQAEDEASAEAAAGEQLESIIIQHYSDFLGLQVESVNGTAHLLLPVLPTECDTCP